jgi:ubiquinone/menaquinone biosynthesis C-methylase UbiE
MWSRLLDAHQSVCFELVTPAALDEAVEADVSARLAQTMNGAHAVVCSSGWWARSVERKLLPWGLAELELGDDVLEIGPGLGATTRVLARRAGALSVVELERRYCERLRRVLEKDVEVVQADATKMPFADSRFSAVVCFTMLHHLPSPELQDRLLAEASRVLRAGGVFAGTDSLATGSAFKLLHLRDILVPVPPTLLPARLEAVGLVQPSVEQAARSFRFRAYKPPSAAPRASPPVPRESAQDAEPDLGERMDDLGRRPGIDGQMGE